MILYNDANLESYFGTLSSTDYRLLANSIRTNVVAAMQSVFTMAPNELLPYQNMAAPDVELFAQICERNADMLDLGKVIDCTGMSVMNTGTKIIIHIDYILVSPGIGFSFWIERKP